MSDSVAIVRGTNDKPVSSRALADFFSASDKYHGMLFIGYPIIGTAEGRHRIDAILVSPEKGLVVFDLVEGSTVGDLEARQDDAANKLEARLKLHRDLVVRRELIVPLKTITFAPALSSDECNADNDYPIVNGDVIAKALRQCSWSNPPESAYEAVLSVLQSITTIRKSRSKRSPTKDDSRGAKLKRLEDSIATLDNLQGKAVIETVNGVQRIRGLAGSGKTIVLALKAAYLHAQHPEWRIAVTFNTRSLKGHFRRLINNFSLEQTGEEPDWERLRVLNAWGAPGGPERDGLYYEFCRTHDIEYFDFGSAKSKFQKGAEFGGACELALKSKRSDKSLYDVVLVDEAQDFPPAFLRLCYDMLKDPRRLVYAYDELQNLTGTSLPAPEDIFGQRSDGSPSVRFDGSNGSGPKRDIILEKCYRNSRPVLVTAHSLGFGIYREPSKPSTTGLVQMFDNAHLWQDIGYQLKGGHLDDGSNVVLRRSEDSSPSFLEDHSPIDDLIQFKVFKNFDEQADWVATKIQKNIEVDELRHDDIVVINPDPVSTRQEVGPIRRRLLAAGIQSHLAGVDTDPDIFFRSEFASVTFTGIYRAKGNEAGMVYVINAQDCQTAHRNLASVRNRLFTAITRSKAWVRVVGIGDDMKQLVEEFDRLKLHDFELHFRYPTKTEREQLSIIHRDMTAQERKRLKAREKGLAELLADLDAGVVHVEDLDDNLLQKLKKLLKNKGDK